MAFLGNLLPTITGAVASIIPGVGNYLAQDSANRTNVKLQEEANKFNERLWERQTEYNTPINQMKRLEEAGLSPHLAYGQVADSKMASAPTMQAAQVQPARIKHEEAMQALASYQQIVNLQEMNKKARADTKLAQQEQEMRNYEYGVLKERGQTRHDAGIIKEILGAYDLLKRVGNTIKDRPTTDFVRLKKDNR